MNMPAANFGCDYDIARGSMRRSIWCEGCGLGNLQHALTRMLIEHVATDLGLDPAVPADLECIKDHIVMVSGIGCTSRMPGHLDVNTIHTTHGRSLAFATGLKMARPELTVVVAAGDGDIFAIGGNHFIHAARRNPDITLLVYDNESYGMTGAQHSPTSSLGGNGTSAPYGVFAPPLDIVELARGAGATFVAQAAVTASQERQRQLEQLVGEAFAHRGFSIVNVRGTCHTGWGARNSNADAFRYRQSIEHRLMPVERWRELDPAERARAIPVGVVVRRERPDLQGSPDYLAAVERARRSVVEEPLGTAHCAELDPLAEYPRTSIRFAGTGGQGVVSAGQIALQATLEAGCHGVYTKSYGPEARGGEAYSDLIVSDGEIHFPQTEQLDVLVALNQESFDKFRDLVTAQGTIIADSTTVIETYDDHRVALAPIAEIHAREVRPPKRDLGINVTALALTFGYLDLVPMAALERAVMAGVGRKQPEMNRRALAVGLVAARQLAEQRREGS